MKFKVVIRRTLVLESVYECDAPAGDDAMDKAIWLDREAPLDSGKLTHAERVAVRAEPAWGEGK